MIGRLAATVDFMDRVGKRRRIPQGGLVTEPADGINRLVFEQENRLGSRAGKDGLDLLFLDPQTFIVGDGFGKMDELQHAVFR